MTAIAVAGSGELRPIAPAVQWGPRYVAPCWLGRRSCCPPRCCDCRPASSAAELGTFGRPYAGILRLLEGVGSFPGTQGRLAAAGDLAGRRCRADNHGRRCHAL